MSAWAHDESQMLSLFYWGQTNLQIKDPVHASIQSAGPHDSGTLIRLKLGESCHLTDGQQPETDANGAVIGRHINCVPETFDPGQQRQISRHSLLLPKRKEQEE